MTFREQLAEDIRAVFLNPDEFGEIHFIDGREIVCVVNDGLNAMKGASADGFDNSGMIGIDAQVRTLYLADCLSPRPVPGQALTIDGETWTVIPDAGAVTVAEGLLTLKLARAFS